MKFSSLEPVMKISPKWHFRFNVVFVPQSQSRGKLMLRQSLYVQFSLSQDVFKLQLHDAMDFNYLCWNR